MDPRILLNSKQLELTLERLCYELIENHNDFSESALIGLQPHGIFVRQRIERILKRIVPEADLLCGDLDITFYRDDFRRRDTPIAASDTSIDFLVEKKKVVLIDDVLFTGRTIRAGLDALMDFGRPAKVELLTLIDRRFTRHLPISPDYTGKTVDSVASERVRVDWQENAGIDQVLLYTTTEDE